MAQDLTAFNPEIWRSEMQETYFKESTALGIASVDLRAELSVGDTLHQPYGSYARVQTYIKGTDISVKDVNATDDYITVSTAKVASFYVDDLDKVQNKYDAVSNFAKGAMSQLNNVIDQAVLNAGVTNAGTTISGATIGETAGNITYTEANMSKVFTAATRILDTKKRTGGERFAMISPRMKETIVNAVSGRETGFGENVSDNGVIAKRFGFRLVLSNNLPYSATWTPADNPSADATVSVNGVVFTFKATPAAAGEVDIGSDTATSIDNLVLAINGTGTPSASTYIELSAENRQLLEESGIVATDGTTALSIVGYGDIIVASSEAADPWSLQKQTALFGIDGSVALITQVAPMVYFRDAQLRLGKYVHPWMLFGVGVFERMKNNLVKVEMNASAWV